MNKNIRELLLSTFPTTRDEVFGFGGVSFHDILQGRIPKEEFNLDFVKPQNSETVFKIVENFYNNLGFTVLLVNKSATLAHVAVSSSGGDYRLVILTNEEKFFSLVTLPRY